MRANTWRRIIVTHTHTHLHSQSISSFLSLSFDHTKIDGEIFGFVAAVDDLLLLFLHISYPFILSLSHFISYSHLKQLEDRRLASLTMSTHRMLWTCFHLYHSKHAHDSLVPPPSSFPVDSFLFVFFLRSSKKDPSQSIHTRRQKPRTNNAIQIVHDHKIDMVLNTAHSLIHISHSCTKMPPNTWKWWKCVRAQWIIKFGMVSIINEIFVSLVVCKCVCLRLCICSYGSFVVHCSVKRLSLCNRLVRGWPGEPFKLSHSIDFINVCAHWMKWFVVAAVAAAFFPPLFRHRKHDDEKKNNTNITTQDVLCEIWTDINGMHGNDIN